MNMHSKIEVTPEPDVAEPKKRAWRTVALVGGPVLLALAGAAALNREQPAIAADGDRGRATRPPGH
jgi:hypothetical protein